MCEGPHDERIHQENARAVTAATLRRLANERASQATVPFLPTKEEEAPKQKK